MVRHIKTILAVGIFICMFLPLSKCSNDFSGPRKHSDIAKNSESIKMNEPTAKVVPSTETGRVIRMADRMPESLQDYIFTLGFILPLLFCIPYSKNRKLYLTKLLVQILFSVWFLFEVYILVYSFFTPVYGGYLLTLLSLAFFVNGLFELFVFIRSSRYTLRSRI